MKVMFDTNVVLDAICRRQDFDKVRAPVMAVANEEMEGIVTANSVTDIYYIFRKIVSRDKEFQNADSPVPVKSLDELLELLERE